MRSGGMYCQTFKQHLTKVQMWVTVTVVGHTATGWQILALVKTTLNW